MNRDFNMSQKNSVVLQTCRWQCGAVVRTDTRSRFITSKHIADNTATLAIAVQASPHISPSSFWSARPSLLSLSPFLTRTVSQTVPPRIYVRHCAFEQFAQSVHVKQRHYYLLLVFKHQRGIYQYQINIRTISDQSGDLKQQVIQVVTGGTRTNRSTARRVISGE